ncbi:hypothetical protein SLS54_007276 [Diplodia seriata]
MSILVIFQTAGMITDAIQIDDTTTTSDSSNGNGSSGLSTPAIIGISLAGGILSATVVLVTIALLFRRRRKRRREARRQQTSNNDTEAAPTNNDRQQLTRSPDSRTVLNPMGDGSNCGSTTPQTANFNENSFPLELESPLEPRDHAAPQYASLSYFPPHPHSGNVPQPHRPSIYELPANHEHDMIAPIVEPPKPTYASSLLLQQQHGQHGSDEKDPTLFDTNHHHSPYQTMDTTTTATTMTTNTSSSSSSLPTSPVSSRSRTTYARWEEVVPDGRGAVVFDTNGIVASRSVRRQHHQGVASLSHHHHHHHQQQQHPPQLWTNGTIPSWPPAPSLLSQQQPSPSPPSLASSTTTMLSGETMFVQGGGGSWYGGGGGTMGMQQRQQQQQQQQQQQRLVGELDAGVDGDATRQMMVHEAGGREVVRMVDLPPSPEREREVEGKGWREIAW